jgi:hypothetical protein
VDYSHMETGPLVWWKSFFATPYRRSCKGLAPTKHFVTVFLACQITIKNVQVQLTVKGNTTPDSYTPIPKSSCAQNVVVHVQVDLAKRRRERTGSYPDGCGNSRSVQLVHFVVI